MKTKLPGAPTRTAPTDVYKSLLLWCSELGAGTLGTFRETYTWLDAKLDSQSRLSWAGLLSNLAVLGHVEVDWELAYWAVAPTVLATMSNAGGLALLVGSQPRWLLRCLDELETHPDHEVRELAPSIVFQPPCVQNSGPPARYVAIADEEAARQLCSRLGIRYAGWIADELSTMLPNLASMLRERPSLVGSAGVEPRRMTTGGAMWSPCEQATEDGAYEFKRYGSARYVFRHHGLNYVADKRTVIYAELARTQRWVLRYDPDSRELLAPARMQLPLPQGRAAVLKSGLLPTMAQSASGSGRSIVANYVRYANIDLPFAQAVAWSLGQALQPMP